MNDESKIRKRKQSIIQSAEKIQYVQVKMKKLRNYGDGSHMRASDKSGSRERITVDSIKCVEKSSLQISVKKENQKLSIIFSLHIYPNCTNSSTKYKFYQFVQQISKKCLYSRNPKVTICMKYHR